MTIFDVFTNGFNSSTTFALITLFIMIILFIPILLSWSVLLVKRIAHRKEIKSIKNELAKSNVINEEIQDILTLQVSNPYISVTHFFNEINTPEGMLKINGIPVDYLSTPKRIHISKMNFTYDKHVDLEQRSDLNIKASSDVERLDMKITRNVLLNKYKSCNKGKITDGVIEQASQMLSHMRKINNLEIEASELLNISTTNELGTSFSYTESLTLIWMDNLVISRSGQTTGFIDKKVKSSSTRRRIRTQMTTSKPAVKATEEKVNLSVVTAPVVTTSDVKSSDDDLINEQMATLANSYDEAS